MTSLLRGEVWIHLFPLECKRAWCDSSTALYCNTHLFFLYSAFPLPQHSNIHLPTSNTSNKNIYQKKKNSFQLATTASPFSPHEFLGKHTKRRCLKQLSYFKGVAKKTQNPLPHNSSGYCKTLLNLNSTAICNQTQSTDESCTAPRPLRQLLKHFPASRFVFAPCEHLSDIQQINSLVTSSIYCLSQHLQTYHLATITTSKRLGAFEGGGKTKISGKGQVSLVQGTIKQANNPPRTISLAGENLLQPGHPQHCSLISPQFCLGFFFLKLQITLGVQINHKAAEFIFRIQPCIQYVWLCMHERLV